MSVVVLRSGFWNTVKSVSVTEHQLSAHSGDPIAPKFKPPVQAHRLRLTFSPVALAGAVARTATTRENAPLAVLYALYHSAKPMLKIMVEDGHDFELSSRFQHLADVERTFLAARVGSGITHLYMEALGYHWRANAECLSHSNSAHADFLYGGGMAKDHGVILVEAHGSFSRKVTENLMKYRSREKYRKQVKELLGKKSCYGKIIHGYSIAFGSRPKTKNAYLCPTETKRPIPTGKSSLPPTRGPEPLRQSMPSRSIIMATYRSNFFLMGCNEIVGWIDWVETHHSRPSEQKPVEFLKLEYQKRCFLLHLTSFHRAARNGESRAPKSCFFAIEKEIGVEFLSSLTKIIREKGYFKPDMQGFPTCEPVGFGFGGEDDVSIREGSGFQYAIFHDGMALLGNLNIEVPRKIVTWYPMNGIQ